MAKQVWTFEGIGEHRCCTLCPQPAACMGDNDKVYDVVWLCTDCADALAAVVNERRATESIQPTIPTRTLEVVVNHKGRAVYKEAVDDGHPG